MARWAFAVGALLLLQASPVFAGQPQPLDRSDPSVVEQDLDEADRQRVPSGTGEEQVQFPQGRETAPPSAQSLRADTIRIGGVERVPPEAFEPLLSLYVGRQLDREALTRLAGDVAQVVRNAGYGLATAWIPVQSLANGVLLVQVNEGSIDAVRVEGGSATIVEHRLSGVVGTGPVRTADLERLLLIAGDIPGVRILDTRLVRENGGNTLVVRSRRDRVNGRISIDNWGSDTIGPVRARANVTLSGLAFMGDSLTVGGATTPMMPAEFQLIEGSYAIPLGSGGSEIALGGYFAHTDSFDVDRRIDYLGDSSEIELEVRHPLMRTRRNSLWLSGRIGVRDSELRRPGRIVRDDRLTTLSGSAFGVARFAGGRLRARVSLIQGIDALGSTRLGAPGASRDDAGGVFTKFEYWAAYQRGLGNGFSVEVASRGQLANRPLLSSEEMGLGGRSFGRGFDYREFSGDQGVTGSVELRYDLRDLPRPVRRIQLYAFGDGGEVSNRRDSRGSGSLASAGAGVRAVLRSGIEGAVEIGLPLTSGRFHDYAGPRLSFIVTQRF